MIGQQGGGDDVADPAGSDVEREVAHPAVVASPLGWRPLLARHLEKALEPLVVVLSCEGPGLRSDSWPTVGPDGCCQRSPRQLRRSIFARDHQSQRLA